MFEQEQYKPNPVIANPDVAANKGGQRVTPTLPQTEQEQLFREVLEKDLAPPKQPPKAQLTLFWHEHKELLEIKAQHLGIKLKTRVACCGAKLMNFFEHWRDWKIPLYHTGWVYHTIRRIREELAKEHSVHVIREALEFLIKVGFLHRRKNDRASNWRNGQDRTYQYLLRTDVILNELRQLKAQTRTTPPFVNLESPKVESATPAFIADIHTQIPSTNTCTSLFQEAEKEKSKPPYESNHSDTVVKEYETNLNNSSELPIKPPVKTKSPAGYLEREPFEWELSAGEPFPDFIRWRANVHYKPQGGHWESGAYAHAAAEIINKTNHGQVAIVRWMWQEFLQYSSKAASSALAVNEAGFEPQLPSCFTDDTLKTSEVASALGKAKGIVEENEAKRLAAAQLAALPDKELTLEEKAVQQLRELCAKYQAQWNAWKDMPHMKRMLDVVIEKVQSTPGLIMTCSGPALVSDLEGEQEGGNSVPADTGVTPGNDNELESKQQRDKSVVKDSVDLSSEQAKTLLGDNNQLLDKPDSASSVQQQEISRCDTYQNPPDVLADDPWEEPDWDSVERLMKEEEQQEMEIQVISRSKAKGHLEPLGQLLQNCMPVPPEEASEPFVKPKAEVKQVNHPSGLKKLVNQSKPKSKSQLQSVEILTDKGWQSGFWVDARYRLQALVGKVVRWTLYDASDGMYIFEGEVRAGRRGFG